MPPLRVAFIAVVFSTLLFINQHVEARTIHWHDTGNGSIALEEAWLVPELGVRYVLSRIVVKGDESSVLVLQLRH